VAWSRLGDDALAEEVTQEAFIRAYRRLWLLGNGAKFAAWVSTIARRMAINFGIRHRRELNRRERWALENPVVSRDDHASGDPEEQYEPETLRRTLAELPAAHRECLVLFYLEGKSGAEAAAALGISESALRVRLHRARAAMRERLEEKLEGSLAKLRPTETLVPVIMTGVLASSSAKAATTGGAGATLIGALAKSWPVKWAFAIVPLFFLLPMMLFSWLMLRAELANYRDARGFRARIFREDIVRRLVWIPVMIIGVFFFARTYAFHWDRRTIPLLLAGFCFVTLTLMWRQFVINHSRYFVSVVLSSVFLMTGCLLIGLDWAPSSMFSLFLFAQTLPIVLAYRHRPARMDYSLFLRAAEGLLDCSTSPASPNAGERRFTKRDLMAFGRFLGSRWMADNYRWTNDGLALRLPPFKLTFWNLMSLVSSWSKRSRLLLAWDGNATAHLSGKDRSSLRNIHPDDAPTQDELESQVAAAAQAAWHHCRDGRFAAAERTLGQVPDSEVFYEPPTRSPLPRWLTWGLLVFATAVLGLNGLVFFKPIWLSGMKPVSVTEAEVRAFLNDVGPYPDRKKNRHNSLCVAAFNCLVLPSTNLYTAEGLRAAREDLFRDSGFNPNANPLRQVESYWYALAVHRALVAGWLRWEDLGFKPEELKAYLRTNQFGQGDGLQQMLTRVESWSWVKSERYTAMRLEVGGLSQLRWLRDIHCLDLIDREELIKNIASGQVLSGHPPDRRRIHDWRDVRGLFFTPGWPALQDTYYSLAALEILEGLDRIDREACIRGILRRHEGKGFFTSPDSGGYNEYHIEGSVRDTIAAYESLRILGGLDRVKDLEKWQFRIKSRHASKPAAVGEVRALTWEEVEAWICQTRWEGILRAREENPTAPFRTLMEP
jgi:RNA polymerase sigma factor (sigma-70 family)